MKRAEKDLIEKELFEINLDDIEGVDLERARFIRGYLKAGMEL